MPQHIAQPAMSFEQALAELQQIMAEERRAMDPGKAAYDDAMAQANRAWPPTVIPPADIPPSPPNALAPPPNTEFLRMLAANPRGWGNAPPAPQNALQKEPYNFQGEISNVRRPEEYTAPIAEMTPPILPGAGMAMRGLNALANPRVAGPIAAAAGFLGGMAGGSEGEDSPTSQLRAQRDLLVQRQAETYKRREAQRASGEGKQFKAVDIEYQTLQQQIDGIDAKIEAYSSSPEGQLELKKEADALAAAEADRRAHLPFGEAYPNLNAALPVARFGAAYALPAAIGAASRIGTRMPMGTAGRIDATLERGRNALSPGTDPMTREAAGRELAELAAREPSSLRSALNTTGNYLGAGFLGGATAAELSGLPDQFDAKMLKPGSAEQRAADERAKNPYTYLWPFIFGAASGVGGKESSALFGRREPNYAGARGVSNALLGPSAAETVPRVIVRGRSGRTFHDSETGEFVSPPRRNR